MLLDYEVAELTWEDGQLAMHDFGFPRVPGNRKPQSPDKCCAWEKPPSDAGTLQSIVNLATSSCPHHDPPAAPDNRLPSWFPFDEYHCDTAGEPCSPRRSFPQASNFDRPPGVGSCSKAPFGTGHLSNDTSGSLILGNTFGNGQDMAVDTSSDLEHENAFRHDFTFRSHGSQERPLLSFGNTLSIRTNPATTTHGTGGGESFSPGEPQDEMEGRDQREGARTQIENNKMGKRSVSTRRSRAAAVHNQSERKRRDRIKQRMKILQKMVPNCSKIDMASMLDELIKYLKQLHAQVEMMSNFSSMMMHMNNMAQQLWMSILTQTHMSLGGSISPMDIKSINRLCTTTNVAVPSILHSPLQEQHQQLSPLSMAMDAYNKMMAFYQ